MDPVSKMLQDHFLGPRQPTVFIGNELVNHPVPRGSHQRSVEVTIEVPITIEVTVEFDVDKEEDDDGLPSPSVTGNSMTGKKGRAKYVVGRVVGHEWDPKEVVKQINDFLLDAAVDKINESGCLGRPETEDD